MRLLLEDLSSKVGHALLSSSPKKVSPFHGGGGTDKEAFYLLDLYPSTAVAKRCVHLIKRLCAHLEIVSGYFQQLIEMSDGVLDGPEMCTEQADCLGTCYYLIFDILNRILMWHEFKKLEHKPLLEDAMKHLATRIKPDMAAATMVEYNNFAFEYVEKFAGSLPYFSCAVKQVQLLATIHGHLTYPESSIRYLL